MPPRRLDLDWKRIAWWCWLGTFVMLVWLLVPVARCSYHAFRDTPLTSVDDNSPSEIDRDRVHKGEGFASSVASSVKQCYLRTPLLDQDWKSNLFLGLAAAAIATTIIRRLQERGSRTST